MKTEEYFAFKRRLDENGVFFTFNGPMSHEFLVQIGSLLRQKLSLDAVQKETLLKVFALVVEQAQNIIFYSSEVHETKGDIAGDVGIGIISLGVEDGHYFVLCGNKIRNDQVAPLRTRLQELKQMNADELKAHYKERRRADTQEGSKGAGLGFIEMARKASQGFEFEFTEIDHQHSFFTVKTLVSH